MAAWNDQQPDVRVSAFDVLVHRNGRFLAAFYACWIALAGLLSYARIATAENPPLTWPEIVIIVIIAAAITVGIALPLAFGLMEGIPMVLAKMIKDRNREEARREGRQEGRQEGHREGRREGRQEGRQEGREETQLAWEAWNQRRETAERDGLPFTEPPPSRNGTHDE